MGIKKNTTDGAVEVAKLFLQDKENQRKHERAREERAYALVEKLIEIAAPVMAAAVESKAHLDQARIERENAESEIIRMRLKAEAEESQTRAERVRYDFETAKDAAAEAQVERESLQSELDQVRTWNRVLEQQLAEYGSSLVKSEDKVEEEEGGYW